MHFSKCFIEILKFTVIFNLPHLVTFMMKNITFSDKITKVMHRFHKTNNGEHDGGIFGA